MKKLFFIFLVVCLCPAYAAWAGENDDEGLIKKGVKSTVSGTISTGKDIISGVAEGIDEGRKEGDSVDGAKIVSNKAELEKFLKVKVTKLENVGENSFKVTIAIQNDQDSPARLTKLAELGSIVLLDEDGFSYPLPDALTQGADVTALARSATRARYTFTQVEGRPAVFRLFGADFSVPEETAAK